MTAIVCESINSQPANERKKKLIKINAKNGKSMFGAAIENTLDTPNAV